MKRKNLLKLVGAIILVAVIAIPLTVSCAAPEPVPAPAPEKPAELESFTVKFSYTGTAKSGHPIFTYLPLKDYVERITDGRVSVDWYPDGVLHGHKDALKAIESGITDFSHIWIPTFAGRFPLMELFHLPGLMPDPMTSQIVLWELFDKYPCFTEQFGDKVELSHAALQMRSDLHTAEPIRNLEELQGKVIACQNESGARSLSMLGASTTIMVGPDAYMAAQKGVVDGIFAAFGWVKVYKLYEVTEYHTLLGICPGTLAMLWNKDTFERFTPIEQAVLKEFKFHGMMAASRAPVTDGAIVRAQIPQDRFIQLSPEDTAKMQETFKPMWDEWVEKVENLGYPARDILEDCARLAAAYEQA